MHEPRGLHTELEHCNISCIHDKICASQMPTLAELSNESAAMGKEQQ